MHKLFESKPTASQFFKVVTGKVIKATLVMKGADISASDEYGADIALKALMTGSVSTPWANLALDEATEADLIAAKSVVPAQTHEIDALMKILRESKAAEAAQPAAPIEVRIVNPEELAPKDAVVRVERNSAGQLTGATAHRV